MLLPKRSNLGVLTPYCAKVGSNTCLLFGGMKQGMIPVYIETLIMTNDDEGFEQLANIINFRVSGGIFLQWNL